MSSQTEPQRTRVSVLRFLGQLADPGQRSSAAVALAQSIGAEALLVFLLDEEVEAYLPAPGFAQTLPDGRAWRSFLQAMKEHGWWTGELAVPGTPDRLPASGVRAEQGSLLVVLGGTVQRENLDDVVTLLPLLAAALRGERAASMAEARVTMLRRAATDAQTLADGLEAARRELQRLYGEVREALQDRDAFLAAVTHDLKTPLTAVYGYVQLLQRQVRRTSPQGAERLLEGLEQIYLTAVRMRRQVDQLLDVARLQMGQPLELDRRPTDLMALVRAASREHGMSSDRHQFVISAEKEQLIGNWDALRLERLLDNLIGNAIKYSPAGGEVLVDVRQEQVNGAGWAVLAVQDSGIGIPAAELSQIFERFYRGRNTSRQMLGSGIGLASAQQIVREHRGTIAVASTQGQGSTFTVRLPIGTAEENTRE